MQGGTPLHMHAGVRRLTHFLSTRPRCKSNNESCRKPKNKRPPGPETSEWLIHVKSGQGGLGCIHFRSERSLADLCSQPGSLMELFSSSPETSRG